MKNTTNKKTSILTITFISGIYEMFCREIFGKKPKTLDFGLQPHKIPDSETVRILFFVSLHDTSRTLSNLSYMLHTAAFL